MHAQLADAHVVALTGDLLQIEHHLAAIVESLKSGRSSSVLASAVLEVLGIEVRIEARERAGRGDVEINAQNFDRETIASNAFDPIDVFRQGFGDGLVVED